MLYMLARAGTSLQWLDSEDEFGRRACFTEEQRALYEHFRAMTYADKVSVIPSLVGRNLFVMQFPADDEDPEGPAISVSIGGPKVVAASAGF